LYVPYIQLTFSSQGGFREVVFPSCVPTRMLILGLLMKG